MCPHGQVFVLGCREGQEGGRGTAEHEKNATCRVFFVMGMVEGQVRAGRQPEKCPSTKIVPLWAQFSCWGQGLEYV